MKIRQILQSRLIRKDHLRLSTASYQQRQDSYKQRNYNHSYFATLGLGTLLATYSMKSQQAHAEEKFEENKEPQHPITKLFNQFEIPKLLKEREQQKMDEYAGREEFDLHEIEKGLSKEEFEQMKELDKLFRASQEQRTQGDGEEEETFALDPYTRDMSMKMKHQEYRTIKVGAESILQNGQMVQVSVCDPFDDKKFHPTDKVILAKLNGKYYAVGSFCGYDYTSLATGAFLGEKLICPTCGSSYNIENGFVEQGPSMRNISSFLIQTRNGEVQLVVPEHIPAFAVKQYLSREVIDPRTFVIVGDSEAALSAVDALRTGYTGRIVLVSTSDYGAFENQEIFTKRFGPLEKEDVYMVDDDYMAKANIEVVRGQVKAIDLNKNQIVIQGLKQPIPFDKILLAFGAYKKRLTKSVKEADQIGANRDADIQQYSNVFYLEDRLSYARCHNQVLKAKTIVVLGGTFEAYQTASGIRDYLDSIGYTETQIILMDSGSSEVQQSFGSHLADVVHKMLKKKRISVLFNSEITSIDGTNKIDQINFKLNDPKRKLAEDEELFIKPDLIIAENGLGAPKINLRRILTAGVREETDTPPIQVGIDSQGIPSSDIRFSLHYNDIHSPILAVGSCTQYPSFVHKLKIRTQDVKYNIEAAFYAAMSMMDKRVEFNYFPVTQLSIDPNAPIYFVGERIQGFHEIIVNGDIEKNKFIAYFVYGDEVIGFMTCGFKNLHLYIWEAMKQLIMPPASLLRSEENDYKDIVKKVLAMRPYIKCKRHDVIKIPSIMTAEKEEELDKSQDFYRQVRSNVEQQNEIQRKKFMEMKAKYDREGIEYVNDEMELADKTSGQQDQQNKRNERQEKAYTLRGARKPGQTSSGSQSLETPLSISNLDQSTKNPFSSLINTAKSFNFGRGQPPPQA